MGKVRRWLCRRVVWARSGMTRPCLVWVVWRGVYVGSSVWWEGGTVGFACDLRVERSRRRFCWGRRTFGPDCDMVLMRGLGVIVGGGVFVCVSKKNISSIFGVLVFSFDVW